MLGAKGHTSTQQAIIQFEEYNSCKSRSVLLEWLQGFEQLCTLLTSSTKSLRTKALRTLSLYAWMGHVVVYVV